MLDTEKLKRARLAAKFTQEQAAQKTGMGSRQTWNNIERGRSDISLKMLDKIATALGVSAKSLLK